MGHGSWFAAAVLPFRKDDATEATIGVLLLAAVIVLLVTPISGRSEKWGGTKLLLIVGGIAIFLLVLNLVIYAAKTPGEHLGPMWPLLLASAAFLYLWWLAALLFDLAFVWHRYIRWSVIEDRLRDAKPIPSQTRE